MRNALLALLFATCTTAGAQPFPEWMTGSWSGEVRGVKMEEHWTTAAGGLMVGVHRDVQSDSARVSFEFLRIEKRAEGIAYVAMPNGGPATVFPLKSSTAERIVFENLKHDFPQRITYWRDGDRLCASVEGLIKGRLQSEEWCWSRAAR